jgi:RNA polymerase sigma-70 factor, ECF subfamily
VGQIRNVTDASELEHVYRDQGVRLWRALAGFSGDTEIASDAVAEAFAQALQSADRITAPTAWVWRAAFKIAAGELQRRTRQVERSPDTAYELPEPVQDLLVVLRRLSPNQRLAVVLHDYADRPIEEVAAVLGASRATVYVHLSQARRKLRRLLEDQDAR